MLAPHPGLSVIMEDMDDIIRALGTDVHRFAGRTVLITGASGMLAGYLCDTLAFLNRHVLDQPARLLLLTRSYPKDQTRLAHLVGRADIEFLIQDACDPLDIEEPVHFIIHAASAAAPARFRADPIGTIDANSLALRRLLLFAARPEIESFLFFSSSEVYGSPEPDHIPTPEAYVGRFDFLESRAYYAAAKRFGETLCRAFLEQYGVPVKMVRPFHVHGPGLRPDDGRIIAALIAQGLNKQPFEILSDGKATRTYGYVADATVGFFKVLLSTYEGQAFNVGADAPETSILELATIIARLFGYTAPVKVGGAPSGKGVPERACPDLTKIRHLLGYQPCTSLETGLARTIRWLRA